MKIYIEIVKTKTEEVVERFNVTEKTERQTEKLEAGININLNHADFHTRTIDSEVDLKCNINRK